MYLKAGPFRGVFRRYDDRIGLDPFVPVLHFVDHVRIPRAEYFLLQSHHLCNLSCLYVKFEFPVIKMHLSKQG